MQSTWITDIPRFPQKLSEKEFYAHAYPLMLLARRAEERIIELFRKGYAKGTVTTGKGNEATAVAVGMLMRPGLDVLSILHRDFAIHLLTGATPHKLFCQYMANADSPTHGLEGNAHHGDAKNRRFPMLSHLGSMLATVVGGVWSARRNGEDALGLAVIGDGGSSTGDFHESLNLASVRNAPVLFLVENNHYAYSTPVCQQYGCAHLSHRAQGYGISGATVDGTDAWAVYNAASAAMEEMSKTKRPYLLESVSLRLDGHAAYDKAEYIPAELKAQWQQQDPLPKAKARWMDLVNATEQDAMQLEQRIQVELEQATEQALRARRPDSAVPVGAVYADPTVHRTDTFNAKGIKHGAAVTAALDFILAHDPRAFLTGQDVELFGSAFKTTKGLFEKYGPDRVLNMPICESATAGFVLGASQTGSWPILEFQFADFATDATTQLGMNAGTWFFRSGSPAPIVFRMPCGGGITMGAFHSGEFEGLWSRFPGLKLYYPFTPQEVFEAMVSAYYDPNPCMVFEHKRLYWSKSGDVDFDGDLTRIPRARTYTEGNRLTVIAWGAMLESVLAVAKQQGDSSLEVLNPFILNPIDWAPLVASTQKTGRLLVVQESGETAGLGGHIIARLTRDCFRKLRCAPRLVAAPDQPVPFAPELENTFRPGIEKIAKAVEEILNDNG